MVKGKRADSKQPAPQAAPESPKTPTLGHNGGDRADSIRNACRHIAALDLKIKDLQEDRANFKSEVIKGKLGMKIADFNMAYRLYGLEGEDRAALFDTLRETFRALGVGGQLNWLDSVAEASRTPAGTTGDTDTLAAANQAGLDAGLKGANRESNPHEPDSAEHQKWDAGWVGGQRQNVAKMSGSTAGAPAH